MRSFREGLQHLIRTRVWGMNIHPTARIAPTAYIDRTWPKGIAIGEGCVIGEEAILLTHDYTRGIYLDTTLGARSCVGPRAIIMPGVTVGEDCLIMPGALVNRDMPPGSVAIGNPARISSRNESAEAIQDAAD